MCCRALVCLGHSVNLKKEVEKIPYKQEITGPRRRGRRSPEERVLRLGEKRQQLPK